MPPAFMLTLRLGLQAFVMIAILHAYVERTAGRKLLPAIRRGTAASVPLSILAALALAVASNQALWIGLGELFTAVLVIGTISALLLLSRGTPPAAATLFLVTVCTITRAGAEIASFFGSIVFQMRSLELALQASAGMLAAATLAASWILVARRVPSGRLFHATLLFCALFVAQLSIYGFHEVTEANVIPYSEPLHWATEPYGPDGQYGKHFSALLVIVPLAYVSLSFALQRRRRMATSLKSGGSAARV